MALLEILNLNKKYNDVIACDNINLNIEKGEIVCLLGESGCGKSTLLKILAGFEYADSGNIILKNNKILATNIFVKPEARNIAILFQEHSLFPHLTIKQNLKLAIKNNSNSQYEEMVIISNIKNLEDRYPHQISGGQQQRVAFVRTLLLKPDLILLDEPFSNLDENTKTNLRTYFRKVLKQNKITTILVTHDKEDAIALADRILIMKEGKIIEDSDFNTLYTQPNNQYISKLFKNINILKPEPFGIKHNAHIGIFPHNIKLNEGQLKANILMVTPHYDKYHITLELDDQLFFTFSDNKLIPDTEINFSLNLDKIVYY
jgi:iron(III) transport system ATP-binding protein